jgi:hypothetical protein
MKKKINTFAPLVILILLAAIATWVLLTPQPSSFEKALAQITNVPTQSQDAPPPTTESTPLPTLTLEPTLTSTHTPSPAPTLTTPVPTPTPTLAVTEPITKPTDWQFYDPQDPALPALFVPTENGSYQLDAQVKVAKIEFLHLWAGWGESYSYQTLMQNKSGYVLNGVLDELDGLTIIDNESVAPAKVDALLGSFVDLYPTRVYLSGYMWADDYPMWEAEITTADGLSILLGSSGACNPGAGPWNVYYNGRYYAQYDGSIGLALFDIFPQTTHTTNTYVMENISFDLWPIQVMTQWISTYSTFRQASVGFSGLFQMADNFYYLAALEDREIRGQLWGVTNQHLFNFRLTPIADLDSVELTAADGSSILCDVEKAIGKYGRHDAPYWKFSCDLASAGWPASQGTRYRYQIEIEGQLDTYEIDRMGGITKENTGQDSTQITTTIPFTLSGELYGSWREEGTMAILPPPFVLEQALSQNDALRDLLSTLLLGTARYWAELDGPTPFEGRLAGEAVFLGTTQIGGNPVRYTIGTPFALENGEFTRWDLTPDVAKDIVARIGQLSPTTSQLAKDPATVINIWYVECSDVKPVYSPDFSMHSDCGYFPQPDDPLIGFRFNSPSYFFPSEYGDDNDLYVLSGDGICRGKP